LNEQIILRHGALGRNTGFGAGEDGDPAYTLQANHPHAVCYDRAIFNQGINAQFVIQEKPPRRYIIRRLTPTECARLQGFPDWWGELAPYNPADAEFWEDVRKTHAEINGKKYKPVKDIKKWYDKLHTDSAEYKMWGNGIALPCAQYVLQGIAEQGAQTLGSLFDGSGGFPLAGVLNDINPIWASEVEPYPIAVTKSRFKEEHNGK
jgi:site-specific DNA-cytosine methylase